MDRIYKDTNIVGDYPITLMCSTACEEDWSFPINGLGDRRNHLKEYETFSITKCRYCNVNHATNIGTCENCGAPLR